MQTTTRHKSAESDHEARRALWLAFCDATNKLAGCCSVYLSQSSDQGARVSAGKSVPDKPTWKLVEGLSLLSILIKADEVRTTEVTNLFGVTGPLHLIENDQNQYLWGQPTLTGQTSGLGGRPDLLMTSSPDELSVATASHVVECKCGRLDTPGIRAEFGKAFDLKVKSYAIWSFHTPTPRIKEGAKRLGLDVEDLLFDTRHRSEFIAKPDLLLAHVANTLEDSRRENRLARAVIESGQEVSQKMLEIQ